MVWQKLPIGSQELFSPSLKIEILSGYIAKNRITKFPMLLDMAMQVIFFHLNMSYKQK